MTREEREDARQRLKETYDPVFGYLHDASQALANADAELNNGTGAGDSKIFDKEQRRIIKALRRWASEYASLKSFYRNKGPF
jgi:hypothetical protein